MLKHPSRSPALSRKVDPFIAMDVMAAANARQALGEATFHLEVGQPGAPVPEQVKAAAQILLDDGRIGYTEAGGQQALRAKLAGHYKRVHGIDLDPQRVIVTTGSSAGFSLGFLLLCEPGDRVALPRPGYPAYRNIVSALGLVPVEIDLSAEDGWVLTPDALATHHEEAPIKCVLIASPNNPTGTLMPADALQRLTDYCRSAGIWFISDEIYHGLVYEGQETCALTFDDDAIIINSFSKYYSMTGWRIGWMIVPDRLVRASETLAQNLFICPPALSQVAAMAALDATRDLEKIKSGYAGNRERLIQTQERLGLLGGPPPDGAFYMYWPITSLLKPGEDATQFCQTLLEETGIAITPGYDFDPVKGGTMVRVSYAGSADEVGKAADIFEDWGKERLRVNA